MRTTLNIDDDLYTAVKVEAARRGETVTRLVEEAMRSLLAKDEPPQESSFPVSRRGGGLRPGVDLDDPDQMYELLYGPMERVSVGAQRDH
jgi:hypothetical protein